MHDLVAGIETDRGLWVDALVSAGYQVYAINPRAVACYRDRDHVSGVKSDAGDAKLLVDGSASTATTTARSPVTAETEAIKVPARGHQGLIWARNRLTNALRSALREYYPAAFAAFDDLAGRDALAVLAAAATSAERARQSVSAIEATRKRAGRQRNLRPRAQQIQTASRAHTCTRATQSPPPRSPQPPAPQSASSGFDG